MVILNIALQSLTKNKTRTVLTVLGIVIGIAAIIIVMSAGEALRAQINGQIESFGSNVIQIEPKVPTTGRNSTSNATAQAQGIQVNTLKIEDGEAIKKLNEMGSDIKYGEDLGNDDEGLLTKDSEVPVFIEKWPKSIKPFYMKRDAENQELVLNDDLIATDGGGEIIGGSQREDDIELLEKRIESEGLNKADYEWYLDLRRYGSVPHSGFGIGLERTVRWITGAEHIRECIPFPRTIGRLKP